MTTPAQANVPAVFTALKPASFSAANGTAAKIVADPVDFPPANAVGSLPAFYGGCTILDLIASSTDAVAKDVLLWIGNILTTQDATNTGSITLSAQNLLTRVNGSWITDGWVVGDAVMLFAPRATAQIASAIDGIVGVVTAVTATDLTVNGTPWSAGTNILAAGTRVMAVGQQFRATVAANAGNTSSAQNVKLIGNPNDQANVYNELKLGTDTALIAGMQAAVSALPAQVTITPRNVARY